MKRIIHTSSGSQLTYEKIGDTMPTDDEQIELPNALKKDERQQRSGLHESTYEYLNPTDAQKESMAKVRLAAKTYSETLEKELPDGPDKTYILRNHRSYAMWANVAITRLHDGTPRT